MLKMLEILQKKPEIGMISGVGSWGLGQVKTNAILFGENFLEICTDIAIVCGMVIALLTLILKLIELYNYFFPKKKI